MAKRFATACVLLGALIVSGCSTLLPGAQQAAVDAPAAGRPDADPLADTGASSEAAPAEASRPFEPETLFNLLIGELSVYNRDVRTAAEFYHREALRTREPQVVSRAARLARYLRDMGMALELAQLWYEVEAQNPSASENLADLYARTGQPLRALDVLEAQLGMNQQPRFGILRNNNLKAGSPELQELLARLDALSQRNSEDHFGLLFTHALLLKQNGDNAAALAQLQKLRNFDGDPVQLAIIESQLQAELGNDKQATSVLRKALRKNPDDKTLKLAYARTLTRSDLPQAEKVFAELLSESPLDVTLLKSHALLAAENGNFEGSRASLQRLLANNREKSFVHYNLGLIAQAEDQRDAAIGHYEQVRPGEYYIAATQKLVWLLAERGQLQQARDYLGSLRVNHARQAAKFWKIESDLLRERGEIAQAQQVLGLAIAQNPNNSELRFERSMLSEKLDDIDMVERDLRHILAREPDNAMALNALGYILADRTTRYIEALDLIEKALSLKPGDPAIIDSLGWAQFRLGRHEEALQNLKRAYEMFPDDEIAAHLIEVYWQLGKNREAMKVYKSIRKQASQHPLSDAVVQRMTDSQ